MKNKVGATCINVLIELDCIFVTLGSVPAFVCLFLIRFYIDFYIVSLRSMLLLLTIGAVATASNPWDKYNFSPTSRNISPVGILTSSSRTSNTGSISWPLTLKGNGSFVVLDFGKEVGGITTISFGGDASHSGPSQSVGLAYSESTNYASCPSDSAGTDCA